MANGLSVQVPLAYSKQDGPFQLLKTLEDVVRQNFRHLVMTIPGERIMDPDFGVGISRFLFENYSQSITYEVRSVVEEKVKKYMPFITIEELIVSESKTNINQFHIYIKYFINSLNVFDELSFVISK